MEVSSIVNPIVRGNYGTHWTRMSQDFLFIADDKKYSKLQIAELVEGILEACSMLKAISGGDIFVLEKVIPDVELQSLLVNHKNQVLFSYSEAGLHHVVLISFSPRIKS